ncbi:MAG: hypothetical protein WC055_09265 [Melioribacteraceae bacterium]
MPKQKLNSSISSQIDGYKFEGKRFWDLEKSGKYLIKSSYDLEVHPFRTEDFSEDDPFVKEIIETGVRII